LPLSNIWLLCQSGCHYFDHLDPILKTAHFWIIMQGVVVVIPQKSAVLVCYLAEAEITLRSSFVQ